jgi:hypothetical protein
MKSGRVEGQDASVDTEQRVSAQHLHIPVLEVEGLVQGGDRGVANGGLDVRSICDHSVGGKLVIRGICEREVGQ